MDSILLEKLSKHVRLGILESTTTAGSGHPSSSLSSVELMVTLLFGGHFFFDTTNPDRVENDRLIFSKGHASPLYYALWETAGVISWDELMTLRKFGSRLEGHPTRDFFLTEVPTGSLGQGLSVGIGMALVAKYITKSPATIYVLLGDSEMAEGEVWEAIQIAEHYKLDNLVGIIDVNGLGQHGETLYKRNGQAFEKRLDGFGWVTHVVHGHDLSQIDATLSLSSSRDGHPHMIIADTIKGKGVSFIENMPGWHGKALNSEELKLAKIELGDVDHSIHCTIPLPKPFVQSPLTNNSPLEKPTYEKNQMVSTRKAYGNGLVHLHSQDPNIVVVDAEVANSTYEELFEKKAGERFFEMFIAEQNMVSVAVGMSRRGFNPHIATFAAFFTRAFDQIRMAAYTKVPMTFCGSHCGVSIGADGTSQMGLEDIAMFRSIFGSTVVYPSDAVSCEKLLFESAKHQGVSYIRTTRQDTPVLYDISEEFPLGGSKTLKSSDHDVATVIGAGITLHQALAAYEELSKKQIVIRVIDLYSIKPIDSETLKKASEETKNLIIVEDHYPEGGIGEAVQAALGDCKTHIVSLAVLKMPKSGTAQELLDYEEISSQAIVQAVEECVNKSS